MGYDLNSSAIVKWREIDRMASANAIRSSGEVAIFYHHKIKVKKHTNWLFYYRAFIWNIMCFSNHMIKSMPESLLNCIRNELTNWFTVDLQTSSICKLYLGRKQVTSNISSS